MVYTFLPQINENLTIKNLFLDDLPFNDIDY